MNDMTKVHVRLTVNGSDRTIDIEPRKSLADALREDCGLTGTHLGCEQGVCGTCTVLLDRQPVRSCLIFAVQCEGSDVRTVEDLSKDGQLHPIQRAFWEHHAMQCGFCTPGFLMLITYLHESGAELSEEELRSVLASNLCRCTGYNSIIRATKTVLAQSRRNEQA